MSLNTKIEAGEVQKGSFVLRSFQLSYKIFQKIDTMSSNVELRSYEKYGG